MQLTKDILEQAAYRADLDADDVRTDYSGRAMYGDTCVGVVTAGVGGAFAFAFALLEEVADHNEIYDDQEPIDVEQLKRELQRVSTDSMGMGMITYWRELEAI